MRTPIRAAAAVVAALALVHCGPQMTTDAGREGGAADTGVTPTDARADTGTSTASQAGAACTDDSTCNGLTCDTSVPGGICTGACSNAASQAMEQSMCGGTGSTCLAIGDGADANTLCTKACRASTATSCRAGFVCTGFWYTHEGGTADTAGCFPFCATNEHCAAGEMCNPRTGSCGTTGANNALLADGQPCTIPGTNQPSPCRGICFRMTDTGTTGICGSFINLSTDRECRDEPTLIQPLGRNGTDNLGICLFRTCSASQCCPNGLVCEGAAAGDTEGFCGVDDATVPNIACGGGSDAGTDSGTGSDASSGG